MLQKFKMTTFSAVLGLVGFMVFSAAPVFADAHLEQEYDACKKMDFGSKPDKKKKKNCFKDLAHTVLDEIKIMSTTDDRLEQFDMETNFQDCREKKVLKRKKNCFRNKARSGINMIELLSTKQQLQDTSRKIDERIEPFMHSQKGAVMIRSSYCAPGPEIDAVEDCI